MKLILNQILIIFLSITYSSAQFLADVSRNTLPTNLNGEIDNHKSFSILNPKNFDIRQGFTLSMVSYGQQSFSVAGLTNNISYILAENLILDANVTLYKSQIPYQKNNNIFSPFDFTYNAGIKYQPTKNSFLELRFQNLPHYQKYQTRSPFNMRFIQ
ncbi:MAG: hypothetical protein CMG64_06950 [Candidatus Marinimicrobia bacterium]|nr:hypothetical protein [Candidatus Neomarinimicrobiota bacterium]|tara:strand:- start:262 stop:732 length:471 start_codon:yes stop_codon:yes gene_type:complete